MCFLSQQSTCPEIKSRSYRMVDIIMAGKSVLVLLFSPTGAIVRIRTRPGCIRTTVGRAFFAYLGHRLGQSVALLRPRIGRHSA